MWCFTSNLCNYKKYDQKLENCNFAYTSYNNLLIELRDSLRSGVFDEKIFFNKSDVLIILLMIIVFHTRKNNNKIFLKNYSTINKQI